MTETTQTTSSFAGSLRRAIDEKGTSVRALAKQMNPSSPETSRSNLQRWLRGKHTPSRVSRRAVAVALELDPNHFDEDDDERDEPDAAFALFQRAVAAAVRAEIRRIGLAELVTSTGQED